MKKLIILLFIPLVFGCDIVKKLEDKKNDLDDLNLNGKVKSLKETTYSALDKFGEPVKNTFMNENEYLFNEDGFIKEIGKLKERLKFKYDDDGNIIENNIYDKDGELRYKLKFKYDDDGNKIEESFYDKNGELDSKSNFKYDDDGNRIEENSYDNDGELFQKYKFKYDDEGNIIEENRYDNDGELAGKLKFKYDDDGNRIERNRYNINGLAGTVKYKYENFDNNKNWLTRIEYYVGYEDEEVAFIIEREIEYYD